MKSVLVAWLLMLPLGARAQEAAPQSTLPQTPPTAVAPPVAVPPVAAPPQGAAAPPMVGRAGGRRGRPRGMRSTSAG